MTTPTKSTQSLGSKVLNFSLLFFLILTILVPITGVHVHKLASTLFLLLCIVHTLKYRNRFGTKSFLLLGVIWVSVCQRTVSWWYFTTIPWAACAA